MQLTEEQLLAAYKRMRDIREFEDRLHEEKALLHKDLKDNTLLI